MMFRLATFSSFAATHYVDINGTNATAPYTDWSTAATNIQDAVDVSAGGDLVLVTNGVYATGGRRWFDSGTNRVTLTNAITLQSVNGPSVTFIVGNRVAGIGQTLTNAARCVGMGNNAVLSGFTLTNGEGGSGNYPAGGGVANITSGASTVTNCILSGNLATNSNGGGAYRVKLIHCLLTKNSAGEGGGASACALVGCLVVSNTALYGAGVYGDSTVGASSFTNCTIVGNSAGGMGGGVDNAGQGVMNNCIVYYNTAAAGSNYSGIKLNNCCTTPILSGDITSFTNAPLFRDPTDGDFRLQSNSPCINAGNNLYVTGSNDLDGNLRVAGGTVDVGAYEFQTPASLISYAYLQQYNLPADGSADHLDSDGDGLDNWQEWISGTNPTNAASVLKMFAPPATDNSSGISITWQSVSGKTYYLARSSDLSAQPRFSIIKSNIFELNGTTSFTDTNATNSVPYFYRVGVQ
jgi:hypothetical protein